MSPRLYNRITNATVLVAVASALTFERAGKFAWLVGAIGILAGVTAAVAYFWNQLNVPRSDVASIADPKTLAAKYHQLQNLMVTQVQSYGTRETEAAVKSFYVHLTHQRQEYSKVHFQRTFERQDRFADQIVAIVNKLCPADRRPAFEFILMRDGNFLIREARRPADWNAETERLSGAETDALLEKTN